jgi:hypothetical protein
VKAALQGGLAVQRGLESTMVGAPRLRRLHRTAHFSRKPIPCLLLLNRGHVRAAGVGVIREPNAELVLLEDPQPFQLRGDDLQGVQLPRPACVLVHRSMLS